MANKSEQKPGRRLGAFKLSLIVIILLLIPTTMEQLMAVSDLGHVMPPKSTWFEPKLASGLFVHPFDPAA